MSMATYVATMFRPFETIYKQTLQHLHQHDCGTYPFGDGANLIARMATLQPRRILELGTALGYTACCFASAAPQAHIDTVEMDNVHVNLARMNFGGEGFQNRVTVHHGKFLDVLPLLTSDYDICFFDGFAPDMDVFQSLASHLRSGGVLICANLGLADHSARAALKNELTNTLRWIPETALEQGGTCVVIKR